MSIKQKQPPLSKDDFLVFTCFIPSVLSAFIFTTALVQNLSYEPTYPDLNELPFFEFISTYSKIFLEKPFSDKIIGIVMYTLLFIITFLMAAFILMHLSIWLYDKIFSIRHEEIDVTAKVINKEEIEKSRTYYTSVGSVMVPHRSKYKVYTVTVSLPHGNITVDVDESTYQALDINKNAIVSIKNRYYKDQPLESVIGKVKAYQTNTTL